MCDPIFATVVCTLLLIQYVHYCLVLWQTLEKGCVQCCLVQLLIRKGEGSILCLPLSVTSYYYYLGQRIASGTLDLVGCSVCCCLVQWWIKGRGSGVFTTTILCALLICILPFIVTCHIAPHGVWYAMSHHVTVTLGLILGV